MKNFSILLMFVFATGLFANEAPPAPTPAAHADHGQAAKPAAKPVKKVDAKKPGHKPTTQIEPTEATAGADKPEGGAGN